jgi:hypothetical protein
MIRKQIFIDGINKDAIRKYIEQQEEADIIEDKAGQ